MPAMRTNEKIRCQYFAWVIRQNRFGVFFADGRSNEPSQGRLSLDTKDFDEAIEAVRQLDLVKAVDAGLADRAALGPQPQNMLPIKDGVTSYLAHVARSAVTGGAAPATRKRYQAVLQKFQAFAAETGITCWEQVNRRVLEGYGAWLDDNDYGYATEYLELTTLKQAMKWFVRERLLPESCHLDLPLKKPVGTSTYCYTHQEVAAMVDRCFRDPELRWLGQVIVGLSHTGLRISELAQLQWTDFDFESGFLRLPDRSRQGTKQERAQARSTKGHQGRVLPIHSLLREVLGKMSRHLDGKVLHGPRGGGLKPDTVRNVLIRDVLVPLAPKFRSGADGERFADGRLHSFRHYFCSVCANNSVPEQMLMNWLGHKNSEMVKRYYHPHREEALRQMQKIQFTKRPRTV
jgi:integrase